MLQPSFASPFEVFGDDAETTWAEGIHGEAVDALAGALQASPAAAGCVVLLRAPRAGYGKTAVLQRARKRLGDTHLFVPCRLLGGHRFDAGQLLEDVLSVLSRSLPEGGGLTAIDHIARQVLALGLEPMIESGEVPCQDKEEALSALRERPELTFDFHNPGAATAQWIKDYFESVGPRLATKISARSNASLREAAYWVELFFRYSSTPPSNVARNGQLFETVFDACERRDSVYGERLHGLLRLLCLVNRPVLVFDETEGLSGLPASALEVVSGVVALSQACPGTAVVMSINSDIWETGVQPRLPGGLKDRLMDRMIDLQPLTAEQARDLVRAKAGKQAGSWIDGIDFGEGRLYARGVLKSAAAAWHARPEEPGEEKPAPEPEMPEEEPEEPEEASAAVPPPMANFPAASRMEKEEEPEAPAAPPAPEEEKPAAPAGILATEKETPGERPLPPSPFAFPPDPVRAAEEKPAPERSGAPAPSPFAEPAPISLRRPADPFRRACPAVGSRLPPGPPVPDRPFLRGSPSPASCPVHLSARRAIAPSAGRRSSGSLRLALSGCG